MKQVKPVVDDSLTLQGKKDKIKSNLQRLAELGKVHPESRYQDLINDIAKVKWTGSVTAEHWEPGCLTVSFHCDVCAGHQEPEAVSAAQESRAGEASADQRRPQLKDQFLQRADRFLQPVHQDVHGQPGQQGQVSDLYCVRLSAVGQQASQSCWWETMQLQTGPQYQILALLPPHMHLKAGTAAGLSAQTTAHDCTVQLYSNTPNKYASDHTHSWF